MVAPAGFPTFPCARCGGALPATFAAGMVIACPLCHQQIVVPSGGGPTLAEAQAYQAWHMVVGTTAAAASAQSAGHAGPFAVNANPVIVEDGAGGLVVVGPQLDQRGWHIRGVDPMTRRVRWETLHGSFFTTTPEPRSVCDRNRRIYVAHEGLFAAIDGASGRLLWQARLTDRIATNSDDAPLTGDETSLFEVGGVVVVRTEDKRIAAYDRETGAALWSIACDSPFATDGHALVIETEFRKIDLVRPRDGVVYARFDATEARLARGAVVLEVDNRGPERDHEGVALVDAATGKERWFARAESPEVHVGVAMLDDRMWVACAGSGGTTLLPISAQGTPARRGLWSVFTGGGPTGTALPWPRHNITALWGVGDAIVIDAMSHEGVRRIAVIEPSRMIVRHDSGAIPDGVAPGVRIGQGLLVYSYGESNGAKTVRAIDPSSGVVRWQRELADLDDIAFKAGALAFRTDLGPLEIVDPATGQTKVSL
jgi:outer membrane protein assembly factor BamB